MNPFDAFARFLDRLYAHSKVLAFAVALAILALGTIALACLNQDGSTAVHVVYGHVHA